MRRLLQALLLLSCVSTAHAQIPVTDLAGITARAGEHAITIQYWVEQYDQLVRQYRQLERTHEAVTGVRNLGDILSNPLLRSYLPPEWTQLYRSYRRKGYEGVFRTGVDILAENRIRDRKAEAEDAKHDSCGHITNREKKLDCEARIVQPSQDTGDAIEMYDLILARTEQISELQAKINTTEDPKSIAELQARIASEQAAIQNMTAQLLVSARMSEAQTGVLNARQREFNSVTWKAESGVELESLTFSGAE